LSRAGLEPDGDVLERGGSGGGAAQEAAAADPVEVVAPDFDDPEPAESEDFDPDESEDFDPDESEEPEPPASEEAATFVSDFSALSARSDLPDFLAAARLSVL